jgi:hypothetical protein
VIEGGPGWHIDSDSLLPVLTDEHAFRTAHADDPAVDVLVCLWSGDPAALLIVCDRSWLLTPTGGAGVPLPPTSSATAARWCARSKRTERSSASSAASRRKRFSSSTSARHTSSPVTIRLPPRAFGAPSNSAERPAQTSR